jgi:hypothetical protein
MSTYDKVSLDRMLYGIILNDIAIESLATDLMLSGWILGKATGEEALSCSKELRKYCSLNFLGQPRQEMLITPSGRGFHLVDLDQVSHWRYSVLRPTDKAELNGAQLAEALRISDYPC